MKVGKRVLSLMLGFALLVSGTVIPTKAAEGGRTVPHYDIRNAGGTWNGTQYRLSDGTLVTDAFFCDGTYTYYLQADGTPMTDRLTYHPDGEHIIYFDTNGHEVFTNFQYCPSVGYICYFDSQGYIYKDQITFMNNKPYYLDGDGRMQQSGWFQFANGMDYGYANWDGTLMNNGFSYDPWGRIVFYHWNGMVARGLITDGVTYYNMDMTDGHLIGTFPNTTGSETETACSHEWKEATCTDPKTCIKCGATEGSAKGHNYQWDVLKEEQYTTDGFVQYLRYNVYKCTKCGDIKEKNLDIGQETPWVYSSDGTHREKTMYDGTVVKEELVVLGAYSEWGYYDESAESAMNDAVVDILNKTDGYRPYNICLDYRDNARRNAVVCAIKDFSNSSPCDKAYHAGFGGLPDVEKDKKYITLADGWNQDNYIGCFVCDGYEGNGNYIYGEYWRYHFATYYASGSF